VSPLRLKTAHHLRAMEGLTACGDAVVVASSEQRHLLAVIDALGHGPDAAVSAAAARQAAHAAAHQPLETIFLAVHEAVARLRGVVMSAILVEGRAARFAGVGNVEVFAPGGVARPVSMAGTLGGGRYRFRPFELELAPGQRWVLASDGLRARESAEVLAALRAEGPEVVARSLIERASRPHDDACALVIDVEAEP